MDAPRALLIDLDNCPRQIESLPQALARYTRVIACHGGGGEPRVPLGLVAFLADAIHDGRLRIVDMPRNGKNAAIPGRDRLEMLARAPRRSSPGTGSAS